MTPPAGQWLGATLLLARPVPVTKPYPHVCGVAVTGTMTGRFVRLGGKDCAACAEQVQDRSE